MAGERFQHIHHSTTFYPDGIRGSPSMRRYFQEPLDRTRTPVQSITAPKPKFLKITELRKGNELPRIGQILSSYPVGPGTSEYEGCTKAREIILDVMGHHDFSSSVFSSVALENVIVVFQEKGITFQDSNVVAEQLRWLEGNPKAWFLLIDTEGRRLLVENDALGFHCVMSSLTESTAAAALLAQAMIGSAYPSYYERLGFEPPISDNEDIQWALNELVRSFKPELLYEELTRRLARKLTPAEAKHFLGEIHHNAIHIMRLGGGETYELGVFHEASKLVAIEFGELPRALQNAGLSVIHDGCIKKTADLPGTRVFVNLKSGEQLIIEFGEREAIVYPGIPPMMRAILEEKASSGMQ